MTTGTPDEPSKKERAPVITAAEVVPVLCIAIGVAAILCSVSLNALFYANLGRTTHEAFVFGGLAAIADVGKGLLPVALAGAKKSLSLGRRIVGWLALAVFVLASFVATLGFFALNRTASMSEKVAGGAAYRSAQQELSEREQERQNITEHRLIAEIDIAIARVLSEAVVARGRHRSIGDISDGCAKSDADAREACNRVLELRGKRAAVERRATLEIRIAELRKVLGDTSGAAGFAGGDPQARRLSELTGLSYEKVDLFLGVLFAVVVELSSGLLLTIGIGGLEHRCAQRQGTSISGEVGEADRPQQLPDLSPGSNSTTAQGEAGDPLNAYVQAQLIEDVRAATSASDIYHDALTWLAEHHPTCAPLTSSRLGRFLQNEKNITADKRGGRIVYRGIRIRSAAVREPKAVTQE